MHIILDYGKSLTHNKTLTNIQSEFILWRKDANFPIEKARIHIDKSELIAETKAQLEKLLNTGLKITYFNSHHHNYIVLGFEDVFENIYRIYNIKMRHTGALGVEKMNFDFYVQGSTLQNFKAIVLEAQKAKVRNFETMVHPAFIDENLKNN